MTEGPVYGASLEEFSIEREIPDEADRERINEIIFKELVNGIFAENSRLYLNEVAGKLRDRGCDAVVLGCTERLYLSGRMTPRSRLWIQTDCWREQLGGRRLSDLSIPIFNHQNLRNLWFASTEDERYSRVHQPTRLLHDCRWRHGLARTEHGLPS